MKLLTWASRARVMPMLRVDGRENNPGGCLEFQHAIEFRDDGYETFARHIGWVKRHKHRFSFTERPKIKSAAQISGDDAFKEGGNITGLTTALYRTRYDRSF